MGENPISDLIAAELSYAAYPGNSPPLGWVANAAYSYSVSTSFGTNSFTTFVNTTTNQIVITFKGSDTFSNWVSDFENSGGSAWESLEAEFEAVYYAIKDDSALAGYQIFTDGHSLGGGMAQTAALEFNLSGYGQNSLPVSNTAITTDSQITNLGGFTNALAIWNAAGNTFRETNDFGDPATIYYSGLDYISTTVNTLENPYAALELFGIVTESPVFTAIGAYLSHSIGTVIQLELNDSSSGDSAAIENFLDADNANVDSAIVDDPLTFSPTGAITATASNDQIFSVSLASDGTDTDTYSVSMDGQPDQTDVVTTNGSAITVNSEIDIGATVEVLATTSVGGVTQDFTFLGSSGTLQIDDPNSFAGTIYNFAPGNTIDLADIGTITSATLGADNLLTVQGSDGDASLQLDPAQNYADDSFIFSSDGNGGINVDVASDNQNVALPGNSLLLVTDPTEFTGLIDNLAADDTIDLLGVSNAKCAIIVDNKYLVVQESDGSSLSLNVADNGALADYVPVVSPNGDGTDITFAKALQYFEVTGIGGADIESETITPISDPNLGQADDDIYTYNDVSDANIAMIFSYNASAFQENPSGTAVGAGSVPWIQLVSVVVNGADYTAEVRNSVDISLSNADDYASAQNDSDDYYGYPQFSATTGYYSTTITSGSSETGKTGYISLDLSELMLVDDELVFVDNKESPDASEADVVSDSFDIIAVDDGIFDDDDVGIEQVTDVSSLNMGAINIQQFNVDAGGLNDIYGGFAVADTAANVSADFGALAADVENIDAISLTDPSTPVLDLTQSQVMDDANALAKIITPYRLDILSPASNTFNGGGNSDILFLSAAGAYATWEPTGSHIAGGGTLGAPGPAWTAVATADLFDTGYSDIILQNAGDDQLAAWQMSGTSIASEFSIGSPGGSWKVVGTGDFNGDGYQDILFRDAAGDLATWDMAGSQKVGGGFIGNPGPGWTFVGTGDFTGNGETDLLFENASGTYATWLLDDTAIVGGAVLGTLGQGWVYKGTGDFTGGGTSDILFENADTGEYAIWDIKDDAISGGGNIGDPGSDWAFKAIGDYDGTGTGDILFENVVTGQYATWELNDATIVGGGTLGAPGANFSVVMAPPAASQELSGAIFFQNSAGTVAAWDVEGDVNAGGPTFGSPGSGWKMLGVGNFYGDLEPDILFENANGMYALWQTNGQKIIGGGNIGDPGGTWTFKAIGDFNGDGTSDILFENASGDYATWDLNGSTIIGGGNIGNPGSAWTFKAAADFTGDGTSDLLFENTAGDYAIWDIGNNQIVGGGNIGNPGSGWTFMGVGDFNGDGKADMLFENTSGVYATWDLSGATIVGGGSIGDPGANWQFEGIADLSGNHESSILFLNTFTGQYATWQMNDTSIIGGATLGSPGSGWTEKAFV